MKVTFLGTGDGVPSKERYCSSAIVEVNGSTYMIDAGAPVLDLMLRYGKDLNALKAIFLTHHHGDHCDGLLSLLDLCSWSFRETDFDIYATEQRVIDKFTELTDIVADLFASKRLRFHLGHEGLVYEDENVKITYFPTLHCHPRPSYAILVEAEGKKVLFSGDLSNYLQREDFPKYVLENHVDLFIMEFAHFSTEHVIKYLPLVKTDKLYINHITPRFFKDAEELCASNSLPYSTTIACDGDVIDL